MEKKTQETSSVSVEAIPKPGREFLKFLPKGQRLSRNTQSIILKQYLSGVKKKEIARNFQIDPEIVNDIIDDFKPVFKELANLPAYRQAKVDLLEASELSLLRLVNCPEKQAKASLSGSAYALEKVHNIVRLEKGLSTQNISQKVTFTDETPSRLTEYKSPSPYVELPSKPCA